jgi:hypothetical protein
MSWWEYVKRTAGTESPKALNEKTGIDGPTFSKWKRGQVPGVTFVSTFAKAYGRPVLEAFVAAEFLTADEAKARPERKPDFTQLTDDELLKLVSARMRRGVVGNAEHPAAIRLLPAASGGAGSVEEMDEVALRAARARAEQEVAIIEMELKRRDKGKD